MNACNNSLKAKSDNILPRFRMSKNSIYFFSETVQNFVYE